MVACSTPVYVPVHEPPPPPLEAVLPAIELPIHAEGMYAPLAEHDPRLDRACEELAFLIAHGGEASNDLATAVLRMHGIVEPPQRVVVGAEPDFGDDANHSNVVIGRGAMDATTVSILIFRPNIEVASFPRAITADAELHVTLDPALTNPIITVADATSSVHVPFTEHIGVPCQRASERYVAIEATDPRTSVTPMVIFPVYCKLAAPSRLEAEPAANLGAIPAGGIERRLAAILARERRGLPPLVRDPRVERAAAAYARDRSEGRQTDRATLLRDAGLLAPAVSWTTFHVDSLESAVNRIVNSPEELQKLRERDRTAFGVGATHVADGWWISIVYISVPPPIEPVQAARLIENAIRGLDYNYTADPGITDFAQRYANGLALGWGRADLEPRALAAVKVRMGHSEVTVDKRVELELDPRAIVGKHRFKYFGVGVAQSARDGALTGTIWIVVLYA